MIGRIPDNKVSIPVEQVNVAKEEDRSIEDPDFKKSLGVANVEDSFEQTQQNNLFEKLGLGTKSIVDPIGYPGEEWLWVNSEVLQ